MLHSTPSKSPETQLEAFISKFSPEVAAKARSALAILRKRLPGAKQLIYDNYNALAIAFSATDRKADIVLSIAVYPRWVSLFLMKGPQLTDPHRLLKGTGTTVRHIVLEKVDILEDAAVEALIEQALRLAPTPIDATQSGEVVVKSVSDKQRPRRLGR